MRKQLYMTASRKCYHSRSSGQRFTLDNSDGSFEESTQAEIRFTLRRGFCWASHRSRCSCSRSQKSAAVQGATPSPRSLRRAHSTAPKGFDASRQDDSRSRRSSCPAADIPATVRPDGQGRAFASELEALSQKSGARRFLARPVQRRVRPLLISIKNGVLHCLRKLHRRKPVRWIQIVFAAFIN